MGKKNKGGLTLAIVLMVISFMLTRNLEITRYNLWYIVLLSIVAISILIFVLVKKKIRGDLLTNYCIKIFCYMYFLFTVTEIIYLKTQPTRYYSSEIIGAYRRKIGTRTSHPAYFQFKIENHYCRYYTRSHKTIEMIRKRKPSIIVYARGEYRRGLMSSIQIRSFTLDTIDVQ